MPRPNKDLIRQTRRERGMKLQELSDQANVNYKHLANIESTGQPAGWEVLHRIAHVLRVPVGQLVVTVQPQEPHNRPNDPTGALPDRPPAQPDRGPSAPPKREDGSKRPGRVAA